MPVLSEVKSIGHAKFPSMGAPPSVVTRQIIDSIKQLDKLIRFLQDRLKLLEDIKLETFKYVIGTINQTRTTSNKDGEVVFKSSNDTIEVRISENKIDLRVKDEISETVVNSSPYNIKLTDKVIFVDTDTIGATAVVNLPPGANVKHRYKIINCGSTGYDVEANPDGTEQLYGAGPGVASHLSDGENIDIDYSKTLIGWW